MRHNQLTVTHAEKVEIVKAICDSCSTGSDKAHVCHCMTVKLGLAARLEVADAEAHTVPVH